MIFLNSIRWRLQLWHGLLLVFVLAGFGFTAFQLQRSNQLRGIDQDLQHRIEVISRVMHRPGQGPGRSPPAGFGPVDGPPRDNFGPPRDRPGLEGSSPPRPVSPEERDRREDFLRGSPRFGEPPKARLPDPQSPDFAPALRDLPLTPQDLNLFDSSASNAFYYLAWTRDGRLLYHSESAPANLPPAPRGPGLSITRMRGTLREMLHYLPPGECILVGRDIGRELADTRRFAAVLLGAGGAVLAFGLAGGWWLATRAIRPIKDISATAAKISTGDLSQRIPPADTDNELGQLANVLNSAFARVEAAFAQQARFTSDAAHELRTPVSIMLTQTQASLTRERPAPEYRETVEACQRAAQRMRRLIESLLELARLDAAQEPIKLGRLDLAGTAADCVEQVRPLASERLITIETDLAATECSGDPERLAQVITNLLTNAIHYNKDRGEVRVSVQQQNGSVILTVTDTGQGISSEDLPHIFERFWRADKARSQANGRTGLGLAIAKSIADAHGGTIEVVSELGKGSTFTLRLPATRALSNQ